MNDIDWNQAPKWATHYCPVAKLFYGENYIMGDCCIPLPTSKQWDGDDLPPIGEECEVQMGTFWYPCEVIGRTRAAAWVCEKGRGDYWTITASSSIRPIKTPEQQQQEELAELLEDYWMTNGSFANFKTMASLVFSKYNVTKK